MADSDSTHFSDKKSYKTHFVPSYSLEDMNFGSFKHLQEFQKKQRRAANFSHPHRASSKG
jgi:hypothetical protein